MMKYYFISLIGFVLCFTRLSMVSAQNISADDVVKRDSILFYQHKLNQYVGPMPPFELSLACDSFLKMKENEEERLRKRNYGAHPYAYSSSHEIVEYHIASSTFFRRDSWGVIMQDKWDYYKKKYKDHYMLCHTSSYNEESEKANLIERIRAFGDSAVFKPLFYRTIKEKYRNNVRAYVNDLYEASFMSSKKRLKKFVLNPKRRRLNDDLGSQMSIAVELYKYWLENRQKIDEGFTGNFVFRAKTVE